MRSTLAVSPAPWRSAHAAVLAPDTSEPGTVEQTRTPSGPRRCKSVLYGAGGATGGRRREYTQYDQLASLVELHTVVDDVTQEVKRHG
jgi:hypothetical protein